MILHNLCRYAAEKQKKYSVAGDCLVCTAATLVSAFWLLEGYMPGLIMNVLNPVAALVMVLVWLYLSFLNGSCRKVSFAVFTALFWVVPPFITMCADNMTDPRSFSIELYAAGEFAKLFGAYQFNSISLFNGMSAMTAGIIFSSVCILIFLCAQFFSPDNID